jgi:hypothetical protein
VKDLSALAALHAELEVSLDDLRQIADEAGDQARVGRIEQKQKLNDQAYFVVCWGQFEAAVDDRCRAVIRGGRSHAEWRRRRIWQFYNPDDPRLSGLKFEDRVALLLDRDAGRGSAYARAVSYYALRNAIAHGRLRSDRIDVQRVVADLFIIQADFA